MLFDIFCRVIDNYGDIGVCWRLSKQLAALGHHIRLITDEQTALMWMSTPQQRQQIDICRWPPSSMSFAHHADVVIETFGCEIPKSYIESMTHKANSNGLRMIWINLEYLSAERYAEKNHLLPSPVLSDVGKGLSKTFFYPGFNAKTGGLLREQNLLERIDSFDGKRWLLKQGISVNSDRKERILSLFCYEPHALELLINTLQNAQQPSLLLVTAGRAQVAVKKLLTALHHPSINPLQTNNEYRLGNLRIHFLPYLTQEDYDHLLWTSDFNFVRGEDSLVRAIWAGKPFIWQIYPQSDHAHHAKLSAFLDFYLASIECALEKNIREKFLIWNEVIPIPNNLDQVFEFTPDDWQNWKSLSLRRRSEQAELTDLVSALLKTI